MGDKFLVIKIHPLFLCSLDLLMITICKFYLINKLIIWIISIREMYLNGKKNFIITPLTLMNFEVQDE